MHLRYHRYRNLSRRHSLVLVGVVAAAIGVLAATDGEPPQQTPTRPAFPEQYVARRTAAELALTDLARTEGLTGLSPLSLRPIDTTAARAAAERALAEVAIAEGWTGLSPVSLRPVTPISR